MKIIWKVINRVDLGLRYIYVLLTLRKADIVLTATSPQTNLGDHAISISEQLFFQKYLDRLRVVEVPKELYIRHRLHITQRISPLATIVISGGGFLGDLWMTEETLVRSILHDNPHNHIIIFPQSFYFTPGSIEIDKTIDCYQSRISNLTINVREMTSFRLLKSKMAFFENIYCIPDMVLIMNRVDQKKKRECVYLCLREDKESNISLEDRGSLIEKIKSRYKTKEFTTISSHIIPLSFRTVELRRTLKNISYARIIITDRLHAMLFAYITQTPCIAIDNISGKLSGVYKWIQDDSRIRMASGTDEVLSLVDECFSDLDQSKNFINFDKEFKFLASEFFGLTNEPSKD